MGEVLRALLPVYLNGPFAEGGSIFSLAKADLTVVIQVQFPVRHGRHTDQQTKRYPIEDEKDRPCIERGLSCGEDETRWMAHGCALTFEVNGPRRRAVQGGCSAVAKPLRADLTKPAVAGPVDRGVGRSRSAEN